MTNKSACINFLLYVDDAFAKKKGVFKQILLFLLFGIKVHNFDHVLGKGMLTITY